MTPKAQSIKFKEWTVHYQNLKHLRKLEWWFIDLEKEKIFVSYISHKRFLSEYMKKYQNKNTEQSN